MRIKTQNKKEENCKNNTTHRILRLLCISDFNFSFGECRTASVPVVGWPPIRSFRKNLASSSSKPPPVVSQNGGSETGTKPQICKKGLFVKINMDGIPIGRKVDLKAYDSYEKLSSAVGELFQGLLAGIYTKSRSIASTILSLKF